VYQLGSVKYPARAAIVLVLAGGGILMTAAVAAAAPATSSSSTQVNYSCSLSGYGQGMAPLPVSATVSSPDTMSVGTSESVKLVTSAIQIPAAIAAQLSQISSISVSGTSQVGSASGGAAGSGPAPLTGQSPTVSGAADAVTEIPSMTAIGTVTPKWAGSWYVAAPQSFQLQPMRGATKLAPLICTAAKSASVLFTVTVAAGAPGSAGAAATGAGAGTGTQVYSCTLTAGSSTLGTSQVPVKLGYSGKGMAGAPENVWMSSAPSALSGSALGGSQWASATPMATSASLGLSGVYSGSIPMSWSVGSAQGGQLVLAGKWMPNSAGMFRLSAPHEFSLKAREQTTTFIVVCIAVTTQTSATTVQVQAVAAQQAAGAATASAGAAGAPNTGAGGSLSPGADVGLAAAGAAVVLGGAGIGTLALRRRRHSAP
jgi:Family of unknown function (DUF6801)